jgi:hypothetical protein
MGDLLGAPRIPVICGIWLENWEKGTAADPIFDLYAPANSMKS